uniref:Transmembrane protein n=1 Tax=Wuchereria bancrofti TaxID=6293 RepID=A0A1I8ESR8_WUCBA
MTQNGQQYNNDQLNMKQKVFVENIIEMNEKQQMFVANMNSKNEIIVADSFATNSESKKQRAISWFLKQKIFFEMICDTKSSSNIFLIGVLFALVSGCSISSAIIFFGRIKHILLTNEPTTESFLKAIYEQIIILAFVIVLTVITHFGMVIIFIFIFTLTKFKLLILSIFVYFN